MVDRAVEAADSVTTSCVAYAEARSALARNRREGRLSEGDLREAVEALDADWESYSPVPVLDPISHLAGELAERFALRGFDAVHLASALVVSRESRDTALNFLSFDNNLNEAAGKVISVYKT